MASAAGSDLSAKLHEIEELKCLGHDVQGVVDQIQHDIDLATVASEDSVQSRKDRFGCNVYPSRKRNSFFDLLKDRFMDQTILILCAAAIVSLIFGVIFPSSVYVADCNCTVTDTTGWIEGAAILVAVMAIVLVGACVDLNKERRFELCNRQDVRFAIVRRSDGNHKVPFEDVVVGDEIELDSSCQIPCDGIVVHSDGLCVDESTLTGESHEVQKGENDLAYANTLVSGGSGVMIAVAVGVNTNWGRMLLEMDKMEDEDTPLQKSLESTVIILTKVGFFVGVAVFFVLAIYWAVDTAWLTSQTAWSGSYINGLIDAFIQGIIILVIGIPEGLPLAVIVSLAFSMQAMAKENVLVRRLEACETLGVATSICSDKTGTLTENRMVVSSLWVYGTDSLNRSDRAYLALCKAISLNSSCFVDANGVLVGSGTECALVEYIGQDMFRQCHDVLIQREPFSSRSKKMTSVYQSCTYIKGAPEILLPECKFLLSSAGDKIDLSEAILKQIDEWMKSSSVQGLRILLFAFKADQNDLVLQALVALHDPIRAEVPYAVECCRRAGISVRIVTGDSLSTANFVAERCGIRTLDGIVLSGNEFRNLSDEDALLLLPRIQVLARCIPEDKLRLVRLLKKAGDIVAVTGDGTNDVLALKESHIGLAMGLSGTDSAKNASDIIIRDDNFSSIILGVKWGRNVYLSIRKFLQFQVTVTLVVVGVVFAGALSRQGSALQPVQLLWVNLIQDTMAALALATEVADELLLQERGFETKVVTRVMLKHIIGQSIFQVAILLAVQYSAFYIPWTQGRILPRSYALSTLVFNTFVFAQVANELNCRVVDDGFNIVRRIHKSPLFIGVVAILCLVQAIIVEFGGEAFKVVPLSWDQWLFCLALGFSVIPFDALLKVIGRSGRTQGRHMTIESETFPGGTVHKVTSVHL